jgi:hypothetical protein
MSGAGSRTLGAWVALPGAANGFSTTAKCEPTNELDPELQRIVTGIE